jgi:hypothetical protein
VAGCDCACHGTNETAEQSAHGDATPHANSGAGNAQSNGGSTTMTAPAGNAEAGVTIGALEQAYNAELASATSFMDQMTSTVEDRKQAASNFDNVVGQLNSARHDPATINEAAAVSEALGAVAQQCEQAKTASDAAVAALNAAIQGISRHQLAREYAGSVQSGASVDAFRE